MQLNVIRHLPTEWNKKEVLQGKKDISISDITPLIKQHINNNKRIIEMLPPDKLIITSTLKRTLETASIYGFTHSINEPLANELDFGEFEGLGREVLIKTYKQDWFDNPVLIKLGEELVQFEGRILRFLEKYKTNNNILLFGHGAWIRGLLSIKECGTIARMNRIEVPNNSLIQLTFSNDEMNSLLLKRKLVKNGRLPD